MHVLTSRVNSTVYSLLPPGWLTLSRALPPTLAPPELTAAVRPAPAGPAGPVGPAGPAGPAPPRRLSRALTARSRNAMVRSRISLLPTALLRISDDPTALLRICAEPTVLRPSVA